ncbi:MAG TPA: Asp23/Gls24 family envelope stress response protein [Streptosporangiaceae bacterium]|jgi:uncharacterized alkaline shock family protein YloU
MTETQRENRNATGPGTASSGGGDLVTSHGRTAIADSVVAKVAGMAANQVGGVYAMGGGMARAFGAVRERIPGSTPTTGVSRGVAVEVGERQAAVDIDLVVEYGVSIPDLASGVRRSVIQSVEHICGLEVTEVNINVGDIHLPGEDGEGDGDEESRVK